MMTFQMIGALDLLKRILKMNKKEKLKKEIKRLINELTNQQQEIKQLKKQNKNLRHLKKKKVSIDEATINIEDGWEDSSNNSKNRSW